MSKTIHAGSAKKGKTYLSAESLIPVTILGLKKDDNNQGKVALRVESTGALLEVEGDYPLAPFDANRIPVSVMMTMKAYNPRKANKLLPKYARQSEPGNAPESAYPPARPKGKDEPAPAQEKATCAPRRRTVRRKATGKPTLASCIDSLLRDGGLNIGQIANAAGTAADFQGIDREGKDLQANVRARLAHYKRKGTPVSKDAEGRLKLEAQA